MKGKWKPYCQMIGGKMQYIAGQQLNISEPLHGGNIKFKGKYSEDENAVESLCSGL